MSRRGDHTLAFALCVSMIAHTAVLLILAGCFVDSLPSQSLGASRIERPTALALARSAPPPSYLLFGDDKGIGEAANASPGDQPMVGRDGGQTQAFLSRDPVGAGEVGDSPSMSVLPRGAPAPSSGEQAAQVNPSLKAIGIPDTFQSWSTPRVQREAPPAAQIGADMPPADPAIMSDSESDAFAKGDSVQFNDGRVDARFGRKVKTIRPQLSLAARYDLMAMQFPRMVVRVSVNKAGSVRLVEITKSSGSESADQAVKVALYQWWFEPPKDKSGAAVADVVEFPIVWR